MPLRPVDQTSAIAETPGIEKSRETEEWKGGRGGPGWSGPGKSHKGKKEPPKPPDEEAEAEAQAPPVPTYDADAHVEEGDPEGSSSLDCLA